MKLFYITIVLIALLISSACNNDYTQLKQIDPKEFNKRIIEGISQNAKWVKSPLSVVVELFPIDVHPEGNASYTVKMTWLSGNICRIIITEESSIDDEVDGERTILDFKLVNNSWQIDKINYSLKRRN